MDVYARLPSLGEPELIHGIVPAASSVLDLGCGVGRIAEPLARLGHRVVAVDNSSDMLAHLRVAVPVLANIEGLRLAEHFGAVLLASHLINTADDDQRAELLATVTAHLRPAGVALIQWHTPDWFNRLQAGCSYHGSIRPFTTELRVTSLDHQMLLAEMIYTLEAQRWSQPFAARRIDIRELTTQLRQSGLRLEGQLPDAPDWIRAAHSSRPDE